MHFSRRSFLFLSVTVLSLSYLLFWPVAIEPVSWQPPKAPPLTGNYQENHQLKELQKIPLTRGSAPEDVAIDKNGKIYVGTYEGEILRYNSDGSFDGLFAKTQGRPLGLDFDPEGHLIVADAYKGLLQIDTEGNIKVLATQHNGKAFRLTDDVDVAPDGMIYFTDASEKFGLPDVLLDFLEHRGNGRLLVYDQKNNTTHLLMDNLVFANGVAVSADQSFLLVSETGKYRVWRYWLRGNNRGQQEIFMDNLPGFPDGVSCDDSGNFWIALASPRKPDVDFVLQYPWLRKVMARLPRFLMPAATPYGFVIGVNKTGEVIQNFQDPTGSFAEITSVESHGKWLYLGSLKERSFARFQWQASESKITNRKQAEAN